MGVIHRVSFYATVPYGTFNQKSEDMKNMVSEMLKSNDIIPQQLHVETSEKFRIDDSAKEAQPNCDLAHLAKHFIKNDAADLEGKIVIGGYYRHFKEGKIVKVVGVSRDTETQQVSVVYIEQDRFTMWNRPIEMFLSKVDRVKYPNAAQEMRFELVYPSEDVE